MKSRGDEAVLGDELVALLATGRLPAVMAHAADGAEERKRLLASLLAGDAEATVESPWPGSFDLQP